MIEIDWYHHLMIKLRSQAKKHWGSNSPWYPWPFPVKVDSLWQSQQDNILHCLAIFILQILNIFHCIFYCRKPGYCQSVDKIWSKSCWRSLLCRQALPSEEEGSASFSSGPPGTLKKVDRKSRTCWKNCPHDPNHHKNQADYQNIIIVIIIMTRAESVDDEEGVPEMERPPAELRRNARRGPKGSTQVISRKTSLHPVLLICQWSFGLRRSAHLLPSVCVSAEHMKFKRVAVQHWHWRVQQKVTGLSKGLIGQSCQCNLGISPPLDRVPAAVKPQGVPPPASYSDLLGIGSPKKQLLTHLLSIETVPITLCNTLY